MDQLDEIEKEKVYSYVRIAKDVVLLQPLK